MYFVRLGKTLLLSAAVLALPTRFEYDATRGFILSYAPAYASDDGEGDDGDDGEGDDGEGDDGGDDGEGDDGDDGEGDDGDDGDDGEGDDGDDGEGDDGDDGDDGDGEGDDDGDDGEGDDNSGASGGGGNSNASTGGPDRDGQRAVSISRVEVSRSGVDIRYADGSREEIENGIYARTDRRGRTVAQRKATGPDISRLRALSQRVSIKSVTRRSTSSSSVKKIVINGDAISVKYGNGWSERINAGNYELKDPYGRLVVRRPATRKDKTRLRRLAQ